MPFKIGSFSLSYSLTFVKKFFKLFFDQLFNRSSLSLFQTFVCLNDSLFRISYSVVFVNCYFILFFKTDFHELPSILKVLKNNSYRIISRYITCSTYALAFLLMHIFYYYISAILSSALTLLPHGLVSRDS